MDFPSLWHCVRAEVSLTNLLSFPFRDLKEGGGNIFFHPLQCFLDDFRLIHAFNTIRLNFSPLHYINVFLIITTISFIVWAFVITLSSENLYAHQGVLKSIVK